MINSNLKNGNPMVHMLMADKTLQSLSHLNSTVESSEPQALTLPGVTDLGSPLAPGSLPDTAVHVVVLLWLMFT